MIILTSRPASTLCSGRLRRRAARSPKTRASKARSRLARSTRTSPRLTASTPRLSNMSTCERRHRRPGEGSARRAAGRRIGIGRARGRRHAVSEPPPHADAGRRLIVTRISVPSHDDWRSRLAYRVGARSAISMSLRASIPGSTRSAVRPFELPHCLSVSPHNAKSRVPT
jgi:hypothetical protein